MMGIKEIVFTGKSGLSEPFKTTEGCPACSHKRAAFTKVIGVYECKKCGAIYGECYLGESYELVLPYWVTDEVPAGNLRYYDLMTLGPGCPQRRHGRFDPASKRIAQVG